MPFQDFMNSICLISMSIHKLGENASLYIILIFLLHSMFETNTQPYKLIQVYALKKTC